MEHIRFTADDPGEDIEIAGIRYQPNNAERVYRILRPEGSGAATGWATLKPDPRNHYDSYAVEVRAFGRKIGYVPARLARRYQDYTLEADRLDEAIELPIRLRGRNSQDGFKVLGSIYLPEIRVFAQRFPNIKPPDLDDEAIPEWADAESQRRKERAPRSPNSAAGGGGDGCCAFVLWAFAAIVVLVILAAVFT